MLRLTYTRRAGAYSAVLGMLGLAVVELALIGGLIAAFVPPPLRWALLAALAVLALWAGASALSPLWTAHTLDGQTLRLRFGFAARADLPRAAIVAAARAPVSSGVMAGATYTAERRELRLALSGQGLVELQLAAPLPIRVGLRGGGLVERLVLGLDEPEQLVAALAPQQPAPVATHAPPAETPAPVGGTTVGAGAAPLLVADGLSYRYGVRPVVNEVSLAVRAGEIYGFLGPNGAGKTTTLRLLVGLLKPGAGRVCIAGHELWSEPLAARAALGYVPDRALLYERLSGREYLQFLAQLRGLPLPTATARIDELLDLLDLAPHAERLSGSYSLGMRRKLGLAGALLHQPSVLILDEPLNGLDPRAAFRLKELLSGLASEGSAILLSTHDLAAAEALASRVGLLHDGRLVAEGRPDELRGLVAADSLEHAFLRLTVVP
jgi:ABC-2 type transport system ATP-binding protein